MDGTKCRTVTPERAMRSRRYAGSRCPPGIAITIRAPTRNGHSNSQTDTSKVAGVLYSTPSPAAIG